MPTGYTAGVADGTVADFRTFALRCARAFGATIGQRDDPASDLPKRCEPDTFYAEWIARDEARIAELDAMSDEEAQRAMDAAIARAEEHRAQFLAKRAETRERYDAMLREVEAWSPPTPGHAELKVFMEGQLTRSIEFDCGGSYVPNVPAFTSVADWLADQRRQAAESLARSKANLAEEIARCAGSNAWIDSLYASLPSEEEKS